MKDLCKHYRKNLTRKHSIDIQPVLCRTIDQLIPPKHVKVEERRRRRRGDSSEQSARSAVGKKKKTKKITERKKKENQDKIRNQLQDMKIDFDDLSDVKSGKGVPLFSDEGVSQKNSKTSHAKLP